MGQLRNLGWLLVSSRPHLQAKGVLSHVTEACHIWLCCEMAQLVICTFCAQRSVGLWLHSVLN